MSRSRVFCIIAILAAVFCSHTAFGQGTREVLLTPQSFTLAGNLTSSTGKAVTGATISLTGAVTTTTTTNPNGHYTFSLPAGSYTITPGLSGYGFDPLSRSVKILKANVGGQNFTTRSISGRAVILPATPLAGVTMTLTGGPDVRTTTTAIGGGYTLDNLSSGTYTVTATKAGYEFTPAARSVKVNNANVTGQVFNAAVTTIITGTAAAKQAIGNSPVTLKDKKNAVRTSTTGTDGAYSVRSTGLTPPFLLKVEPTGGPTLYSVSADAKAATTINLTPLTDMIIRSWYNVKGAPDMETAFNRPDLYPPPSPANVMLIATILKNMLNPWLVQAGVDAGQFNLISTPFAADGTGVDKVLQASDVTVTGKTLAAVITNGFTTQSATMAPVGSTLTIASTAATPAGSGSSTVSRTFMPKTTSGASATESIAATIKAFVNTVNTRGALLTAADLAPYVDPSYIEDGMNGAMFRSKIVGEMKGLTVSFAGLGINSMNAAGTVADVSFQVSEGITQTATSAVEMNFTLGGDGIWRMSGNGRVAQAEVMVWAWMNPEDYTYTNSTRFAVYDIKTNNVQSVKVSGLGIDPAHNTVPMVCDYPHTGATLPQCGNSHGSDSTKRGFELDIPGFWPAVGAQYTLSLTCTGGFHNYTVTIGNEYGFDAGGAPVPADYPIVTLDVTPTITDIMAGTTITGTIYVPVWAVLHADQIHMDDQLHFNYEGPGGTSNDVSNIDINGQWVGTPAGGAFNTFTMTIPAATSISPYSCGESLSGTCYTITFNDATGTPQTGNIQGGWFGFDANNEMGSSTNNGVEIH